MQFAKNRIERLKVMGFKNIARYLASFLHFQSDFKTYEREFNKQVQNYEMSL